MIHMNQTIIDLERLLQTPCVDTEHPFDLSPDGKMVAFAWNLTGGWEIYELPLDGSAPPRQVTGGPGGKFSPRYSPDGQRLAYMVDFDGGENFRLFTWDIPSGVHASLTPGESAALQPDYAWSPDGTRITVLSNRSGSFKTYVMPAEGGANHLALDSPYPAYDVRWSPDGRYLLVIAQTVGADLWTFIVPLDGQEAFTISDENGPLSARDARWSPDGERIAFASNAYGEYEIGIYTLASREVTWVTQGDGEKTAPAWSPDGKRLVYVHCEEAISWLGVLDIDTLAVHKYPIDVGLHALPEFTQQGDEIVCIFDNPGHPDDLWLISLPGGATRQLTDSLPPDLHKANFILPKVIRYPGLDGVPVPALLYQPPSTGQLPPAVVLVHGGPNWRFDVMWYPLVQHMLSRGWVLLLPNYRGSTGYGREWQYASRYDQGGVDTRDVVAGAHYLIQNSLADPKRIAVTGRSHGGYLTMTSLTQYPEIWAAGSAVVPFLNWFTSHPNSRDDLQHWDREFFGDPVKDHDLWYERSPFFFLDRVRAPVQLICGANDPRCPASESIAARDALQALGKRVDFTLYADEGHGFLKTENVVDSELRRVAFLAKELE